MKSVMLSIRPKWCELIANGKKTIEVRKTRPKLETPFKCYIYCTLPPRSELFHHGCIYEYAHELIRLQDGRIVYDYGMRLSCENGEYSRDNFLCRKVIGEFVCDKIYDIEPDLDDWLAKSRYDIPQQMLDSICLSESKLWDYGIGSHLYGWHISDLKIYDTPKELGEFNKPCPFNDDCDLLCPHAVGEYHGDGINGDVEFVGCGNKLTRPPQSWCYVEAQDE